MVAAAESRTAVIKRGNFLRTIRITGSTQAVRAYVVQAPQLAGGGQRMVLVRLVHAGTRVHKDEVLAEFDQQDQLKQFRDSQADYLGFLDKIKKLQADNSAALAKDQTALQAADDDYQKAKLEMMKNEVVSRIDADRNRLTLEEDEATWKQLRQTFDLKERARQAQLKDLEIQRDKAHGQMLYAQINSQRLVIHSPLEGLVVLSPIWKGSSMGDAQEGDEVWPGSPFMQVVDPSAMQVAARVNQVDFPYLRLGQRAEVRLDAYSDLVLSGSIEHLAAIGNTSTLSQAVHNFNATFAIQGTDPRLLPDLSAAVDVELVRLPDVLLVPRDALVLENGKTYAWVKRGASFEKSPVTMGQSNDDEAVVLSGLVAGDMVRRNPEETRPGS
ncbi:MAG TPA: efflux RND transporter periplasmic adaptor subunit [Terriglobia bacterium]|nr:efflux RND transporter periplasmic adaptor subunit [Terriglobia bacterium]